ncbi:MULTISPECIES: alpha/beta hydrolase fold domain-containing protein [Streptomyces]|uniref:alpha/beta hydrolase fold domain-containing protein n=1 Tax=Streptomyces TaxID=1883 RepID=UPI00240DCCC2|nr:MULTISPECIES: alpha/beta hydrolase fold domain-containing protein [Streptomyces]WFB88541.1 alpha/beta hydrolase [Streptomyces olivaceus]WGK50682.1 alpha/beta hydrolase [Streptomyces sp. B146]
MDERRVTTADEVGDVHVRVVEPTGARGCPLYVHGGGWVPGNAAAHGRPVHELVTCVRTAVVFMEYGRSPEARCPVAIEQAHATARWIGPEGAGFGLDSARLAVADDLVGGNMASVPALMAQERGDSPRRSLYPPRH